MRLEKCHFVGIFITNIFGNRTFFRRCVLRRLDIPCINGDGRCVISPRTRKDCTRCRFDKCLSAGMRPDLVTDPTTSAASTSVTRPSAPRSDMNLFQRPYDADMIGPRRQYVANRYNLETPSIPRPEIETIDTHIQGLTINEKVKLFEMINLIQSTNLQPEDLIYLVGDTRSDLNTMTCIFISRVIRALNMLQSAAFLTKNDRRILLRGSVGKIIFLRLIPQFDFESKCWILYKNPVSN